MVDSALSRCAPGPARRPIRPGEAVRALPHERPVWREARGPTRRAPPGRAHVLGSGRQVSLSQAALGGGDARGRAGERVTVNNQSQPTLAIVT